MAYKQVKKYGYRDALEKGDPEKVIYGVDFDAEFEAIEAALDGITGGDSTIDPTDPAFEDVVFQNRSEAQKVISEFTFEKSGDSPLTMKNTGMYAGTAYIRYTGVTWEVEPSLSVTGDITAGGNLTIDGTAQLNGDLNVDGSIDATGSISLDGDLAIGGVIEGDLTVNGNITIDGGGTIIDGGGNPIGGGAAGTHIGELPPDAPEQGQFWLDISGEAVMWIYDDGKWLQHPSAGGGGLEDAPDDGKMYARQSSAWEKLDIRPDDEGNIEDGTQDNQLAHWEGSEEKWVPVINCSLSNSGNLGLGVTLARSILHLKESAPKISFENANGYLSRIGMDGNSGLLEASSDLAVYGDVTANNFIGDGSQLTNVNTGFVICTQAEYDGLTPAADTVYFIK